MTDVYIPKLKEFDSYVVCLIYPFYSSDKLDFITKSMNREY